MAQKRILILGANGLLGTVLTKKLKINNSFEVITHSQTSAADLQHNLSDEASVRNMLLQAQADFCINLFALTDVNQCEVQKEKAYEFNVTPVKNIAATVHKEKLNLKLIQISTDHVYDKCESTEADIKIVNYYAESKYLGDQAATQMDAVVLRTNFFGASQSQKQSFSDWIIASLSQKNPIKGYSNVHFSPLHLTTLTTEIERVIHHFKPGIYNVGSHAGLSKYEFMVQLAQHKNLSLEYVSAVEYRNTESAVPRPLDMRMNLSKYEKTFNVKLPTLIEEIQKC